MFKVDVDLMLVIDGCPESGLEAIKWRASHGLPEAPHNKIAVQYSVASDRKLCESWSHALNSDADLIVKQDQHNMQWNWQSFAAYRVFADGPALSSPNPPGPISVEAARTAVEDINSAIDGVFAELESHATKARELREAKEAVEIAAREQKERDHAALVATIPQIEMLPCVKSVLDNGSALKVTYRWLCDENYDIVATTEDLPIVNDRNQQYLSSVLWVTRNGSERLKRCLAENIDCYSCYLDERLSVEFPGWRWESDVDGKYSDPRNPSEEAFELLDEARKTLPDGVEARLVYWVAGDWRGYAVLSEFLSNAIVFGGPKGE